MTNRLQSLSFNRISLGLIASGLSLWAVPATTAEIPELTDFQLSQNEDSLEPSPMAQFNRVSQFSDIRPTDWAFQALQDLIERYDCLVGYPDGAFRGNRPLSRYEFAAGLNACMNQIERLLAEATEGTTREDLETLLRLMQEFETELAGLGTRVDGLEARTMFLEDHSFTRAGRARLKDWNSRQEIAVTQDCEKAKTSVRILASCDFKKLSQFT